MLLFTLSSIGLPGMNGFAGEFMILVGMFQRAWAEGPAGLATLMRIVSVVAVGGVVLGAWYMLWLVQRVFFGPLREPATDEQIRDLNAREIAALVPLALFVFWIGLYPKYFLEPTEVPLHVTSQAASRRLVEREVMAQSHPLRGELLSSQESTDELISQLKVVSGGGIDVD